MRLVPVALAMVCLTFVSFAAVQQGKKDKDKDKEKVQKAELGVKVALTKRKDNGPYGTCAYSFRYATQDVDIHRNDVDIVFSGCGLLHIAPQGGLKNRIAKVDSPSFAACKMMPAGGWNTQSIEPENGAIYVMEVDDEQTRMRIKIHITSLTETEVGFEWAPFRDVVKGASGTLGQCTGKHGAG